MRNVIITGVNGQLGKVFAQNYLDKGDRVFGIDILETEDNINNPMYSFHKVDITNEKSVIEFFRDIKDVSVLINNAGIGKFSPLEERTAAEFIEVCNVNMLGTFLMCKSALVLMKEKNKGQIINIGSVYGVVSSDPRIYGNSGRNNSEVYSMTKAAVIMLSRYLAANYGKYNIQVNTLSPGGIYRSQDEEFVKNYSYKTPAQKMGCSKDLLPCLNYLSEKENTYTNGQNIVVDGGFSIW